MSDSPLPHILVADDDSVTRLVAKALLEKNGFQVSQAADGAIAIELLGSQSQFALIVLDVNMPFLTGPEVLRKVRASASLANLPVLFLTGTDSDDFEASLLNEGATGCIRKPINPARFLERIRAALLPATT